MRGQRKSGDTDATITFTFESAYNQIVQPTSYVSLSQYFIAHWMPDITGAGLKILLQLRSMGYYSPKAGVQRGDIDIEQKELAALCGLSHSTLKRAFADDPVLSAYVQRVFEVKRDPLSGRIIKEHYLYVVKMDDVLIPADKAALEAMLQGPDKSSGEKSDDKRSGEKSGEKPSDLPTAQNDPSASAPTAQSEPPTGHYDLSGVQSEPPTGHNDPPTAQNDPSLNRSLTPTTPNTFDTLDTPAADPEILAPLFGEENTKEEKPSTPPRPWADLPPAEQHAYIEQARAELEAVCQQSGATLNLQLIESRGKNLYRLAHKW